MTVCCQVPETLQYRVVRQLSRNDMTVISTMVEAPGILEAKPRLTGRATPQQIEVDRTHHRACGG